jgi:hypothetical protein
MPGNSVDREDDDNLPELPIGDIRFAPKLFDRPDVIAFLLLGLDGP